MWSASLPPRRIQALPDFRHSAAASTVTLGRDSKMMATSPMGTRRRIIFSPFGRSHASVTSPTGSGNLATSSQATAIASRRPWSRRRRSVIAGARPLAWAAARSCALAARMAGSAARRACAAARRAWSRVAVEERATERAAALAARARAVTRCSRSLIAGRSASRVSCPRRFPGGRWLYGRAR